MDKIPTGIPGLDEMLEGGLIKGRPYLVCGGPGAGKTIFGMQFLLEGAEKRERGLFIALEESAEEIRQNMSEFGWNLHNIKLVDTYQDSSSGVWQIKSNHIMAKPELNLSNLINLVQDKIRNYKPSRIVLDSITTLSMLHDNRISARRDVLSLMNFLSKSGVTSILTSETINPEDTLMEEFLSSGVIKLVHLKHEGETLMALSIEKMRGSGFDRHMRPMKITEQGIVVFPMESVFS